jgi:hypothetical protein
LKQKVELKLIYVEAKKAIPADGLTRFEKEVGKDFDDRAIDEIMKRLDVTNRAELDQKLREMGTTLDARRRAYVEDSLANQWRSSQTDKKDEAPPHPDELLAYYKRHIRDYTTLARAKWEELLARFDRHGNNREATQAAIAQMGNAVVGGASFAEVAKAQSDGTTASEGGEKPWTTQGSLTCEALDHALFTQRVGELSPSIIESPLGYHIVRVTQREEMQVKDFRDAQDDIREKIVKERKERARREFMAKLEAKTPVEYYGVNVATRQDRDAARRY